MMMTELCQILRNWFDRDQKKWYGEVTISNGEISLVPNHKHGLQSPFVLKQGQYYRIIGSLLNDGVHKYPDNDNELVDEEFSGAVWAMAVPPSVIALCDEIQQWQDKYGGVEGALMSPYSSESFAGYSYTKASGYSSNNGSGSAGVTWQDMFASRLNAWRKI